MHCFYLLHLLLKLRKRVSLKQKFDYKCPKYTLVLPQVGDLV